MIGLATLSVPGLESVADVKQLLGEIFREHVFDLLGDAEKGLGDAAGNSSDGIAVPADGDAVADHIFIARALQEANQCLGQRDLADLLPMAEGPPAATARRPS